jgi:hypothetical protein
MFGTFSGADALAWHVAQVTRVWPRKYVQSIALIMPIMARVCWDLRRLGLLEGTDQCRKLKCMMPRSLPGVAGSGSRPEPQAAVRLAAILYATSSYS